MSAGVVYSFGRYEIDTAARRLRRDGETIAVSDRHLDVLIHLVAQPGVILSKDALVQAGWGDVAVTDNSLEQAISSLRRALADPYIETVPRRGYRFAAEVSRTAPRQDDAALDGLLAPHRAWLDGRSALGSMKAGRAPEARAAFAAALRQSPDYAPAHVGLANACIFQFESTRADLQPDRASLQAAVHHAREACRLDAADAEAWATLGFALQRSGQGDPALAATRRAASLEPDNWRVMLRLAYVSWGEERLRAAHHVLALLPGLAMAHWLAATVYVARQAFDRAAHELRAATTQAGPDGPGQFSAVAVHWLLGLVLLATGDEQAAAAALRRELAQEPGGHLYARECSANAWYALGVMSWRAGDVTAAAEGFTNALERVPAHPFALGGLALLDPAGDRRLAAEARAQALREHAPVEAALVTAVLEPEAGAPERAVTLVAAALDAAPAGGGGWLLPVEPLLAVHRHAAAWAPALARLRARAV